ncbi:MAG TPA: MFS transporter [Bryobacteraceae bacterium]|nr:MFS transporter [Bryobacteraceae bacterium]
MADQAATLGAYPRLLRTNRNFRLLWFAQIVSEIGDWFYAVAVYGLLLAYTGKAQSVAFAFVLQVLPQFFVAPTAGVINDRLSRRRVMMVADWTRAVIVLCMVLVRGPQLVWLLYLLLFLETIMWALFEPGRSAVVPNVVEDADVVIANTLSSTTWSVNFAIGFALGGVAAAYWGRDTVFVINSLSFVVSAICIGRMRFREPHAVDKPPLRFRDLADFSPILEGLHYVRRDQRLRTTIFVKAGLGLLGSNWVLLPILGERIFPVHRAGFSSQDAGMLGMSVLMASRGLGAIAGPLLAGKWAGNSLLRMRWGILFGFLAAGLGYVALSGAGNIWLACAALIVAHAGGSVMWVFSTTLLQLMTEDRLRGRVFSAEFGFSVLTMSASSSVAGFLIDQGLRPRTVAGFNGLIMLLPAVLWAWVLRRWPKEPVCSGCDEKNS